MRKQSTTRTEELYFRYLCGVVSNYGPRRKSMDRRYEKLLRKLYSIQFVYFNELDENRIIDAEDMKRDWEEDNHLYLERDICSVLEVLVALVKRVEYTIMDDDTYGDRTGQWFWIIIENLELDDQNEANYDEEFVEEVIENMLYRKYDKYGNGGMFYVEHPLRDMRDVDIWMQFMWYLNENF